MARLSRQHHLRRALPAVFVGLVLAPITLWHAWIFATEISGQVTEERTYSEIAVLLWSGIALVAAIVAFGVLGQTVYRTANRRRNRRPRGIQFGGVAILIGMVAFVGVYSQIAN